MLKKLMLAGAGLVLSVPAFAHHGWGGHARHYYNYPPRVVYAPAPAPVYAAPVPSSFFSIRLDFPF